MTQQQTQIALQYTRLTEQFPLGSAYCCFYNDRLHNWLLSNAHKASPLLVLTTLYLGKQNFKNNILFSYILKRIRGSCKAKKHCAPPQFTDFLRRTDGYHCYRATKGGAAAYKNCCSTADILYRVCHFKLYCRFITKCAVEAKMGAV